MSFQVASYQLGNVLGKGAFGAVYRALNTDNGQMVAIKQVPIDQKDGTATVSSSEMAAIMSEVHLLRGLAHPNIVSYIDCLQTDSHLYIVLEYVESGSLYQLMKQFGHLNEKLVAFYVRQILEGLKYLHGERVVHCDLKCANVLIDKRGSVKLTDFGVSRTLKRPDGKATMTSALNVVGTPYWMAPEIIQLEGATTASDIWSLGCVMLELVTGQPPYFELPAMSAMFHIVEDARPPLPDSISPMLREMMLRCFEKEVEKRATAAVLLLDPFLVHYSTISTSQPSSPVTSSSPSLTNVPSSPTLAVPNASSTTTHVSTSALTTPPNHRRTRINQPSKLANEIHLSGQALKSENSMNDEGSSSISMADPVISNLSLLQLADNVPLPTEQVKIQITPQIQIIEEKVDEKVVEKLKEMPEFLPNKAATFPKKSNSVHSSVHRHELFQVPSGISLEDATPPPLPTTFTVQVSASPTLRPKSFSVASSSAKHFVEQEAASAVKDANLLLPISGASTNSLNISTAPSRTLRESASGTMGRRLTASALVLPPTSAKSLRRAYVWHALTSRDLDDLQYLFQLMDKDRSGLCITDAMDMMRSVGVLCPTETYLRVAQELNISESTKLSFDTVLTWIRACVPFALDDQKATEAYRLLRRHLTGTTVAIVSDSASTRTGYSSLEAAPVMNTAWAAVLSQVGERLPLSQCEQWLSKQGSEWLQPNRSWQVKANAPTASTGNGLGFTRLTPDPSILTLSRNS